MICCFNRSEHSSHKLIHQFVLHKATSTVFCLYDLVVVNVVTIILFSLCFFTKVYFDCLPTETFLTLSVSLHCSFLLVVVVFLQSNECVSIFRDSFFICSCVCVFFQQNDSSQQFTFLFLLACFFFHQTTVLNNLPFLTASYVLINVFFFLSLNDSLNSFFFYILFLLVFFFLLTKRPFNKF